MSPQTTRVLQRFCKQASESPFIFLTAQWVSPTEFASMIYCIITGEDIETIVGDKLREVLATNKETLRAFNAKEKFDEGARKLQPSVSRAAILYPLDVIKEHRKNITLLPAESQRRLTDTIKAMTSFMRYQQALQDARSYPTLQDEIPNVKMDYMDRLNEIKELVPFPSKYYRMADGPEKQAVLDNHEKQFEEAVNKSETFIEAATELLSTILMSENFVLNTFEGPTISRKDSDNLIHGELLEKTLKDIFSKTIAAAPNYKVYSLFNLGLYHNKSIQQMLKNYTETRLIEIREIYLQRLKSEVPATLIWSASGGKHK